MSESNGLFVRVGDEVRGPYLPVRLRDLAEAGVVTPATAAAPGRDGPWTALGEQAARAEIFPERAQLGFKPTEFPVLNRTTTEEAAPLTVQEMVARAAVPGKILRPERPAPTPGAAGATAPEPNEVEAMVRAVQAIEEKFAPPPAPLPRWRPSGRLKVCGTLALLGNGVILAIPMIYGSWDDFWSMTIVRGWFAIWNGGLVAVYFNLPKN
jgi:hypothetical protein